MQPDESQERQSGEGEKAKPQSPEPSQKSVPVPVDTDEDTLVVGSEDDEVLGAPPAPPDPSCSTKTMPPQAASKRKTAISDALRSG
jgi:hypothetical protein